MSDVKLLVLPSADPAAVPVDNELVENDQAQEVYRQKVAVVNSDDGPLEVTSRSSDLAAAAPAEATVTTGASGEVLAANPIRKGCIIQNLGPARVSLGLDGAPAVLGRGITLDLGQSWTMGEYDFTTGAVDAIADSGGATLAIQEFS